MDWRINYLEAEVFAFPALGSDHNPLLLTIELNPLRRRKTFTFEAFWLQDKDCRTVIRDAWASSSLPVSSLSCKLQDTSLALTGWSKSKFSNGQKQIHLLKQHIWNHINQPSHHYDKALVSRLKDEVQHVWQQEKQYWVMRSRI